MIPINRLNNCKFHLTISEIYYFDACNGYEIFLNVVRPRVSFVIDYQYTVSIVYFIVYVYKALKENQSDIHLKLGLK